jgi:tetratricopeptide (TPR) repeat protein
MKKILLALMLVAGLPSCKDYLTTVPSDAMFLSDVQACKQNLAAWLVNYRGTLLSGSGNTDAPSAWLTLIAGDKYQAYADVWNFHTWSDSDLSDQQKRLVGRSVINEADWSTYYAIIGRMNLIVNELTDAVGDDQVRNYVKGEALMHRAFCFFKLLQYYAPVDNASLGIPVYTDTDGGFDKADLSRQSHRKVYDRILGDLAEVERLLGETAPRRTYNVMYNHDNLYRLRSQVYLWKASTAAADDGDWDRAAEAASKAIELTGGELPYNVATLFAKIFGGNQFGVMYQQYEAEARMTQSDFMGYPETMLYSFDKGRYTNYGYDIDTWRELYRDNDTRRTGWFLGAYVDPETATESDLDPTRKLAGFWPMGLKTISWFRLAEQYLILIEAQAHTDFNAGMETLRKWQSTRYTGTQTDWATPVDAQELLEEVRLERRREFVLEGDLLWLDMKRFKVGESEARSAGDYTAAPLTAADIRYQFMIPDSETATNTEIVRNPGWEQYRVIQ